MPYGISDWSVLWWADYYGRGVPYVVGYGPQANGKIALASVPVGSTPIDVLAFNHSDYPPSSEARRSLLDRWLIDLVDAVSFLHENDIIHRDIKPPNMILVGGTLQLIDFGIACAKGAAVEAAGTTTYASANALNEGAPAFRDDWESLALSVYSLYVGIEGFAKNPRPSIDTVLAPFPQLRCHLDTSQ